MPLYYDDNVNSIVTPVCLPWEPNSVGRNLTEGSVLTVTGWSRISKDPVQYSHFNNPGSDILQKSTLNLSSEEKCINQKMYKDEEIEFDFHLQFCARAQNCWKYSGDMGGPVVYSPNPNELHHQVGIVSFGAKMRIPGVFTKITPHLDWIEKVLQENEIHME